MVFQQKVLWNGGQQTSKETPFSRHTSDLRIQIIFEARDPFENPIIVVVCCCRSVSPKGVDAIHHLWVVFAVWLWRLVLFLFSKMFRNACILLGGSFLAWEHFLAYIAGKRWHLENGQWGCSISKSVFSSSVLSFPQLTIWTEHLFQPAGAGFGRSGNFGSICISFSEICSAFEHVDSIKGV